jgi:DNA polymerase I-like protein with 3'-5' exonuclease and polymerase domains
MLLTVHDELVFEVPSDELESVASLVREEMEEAIALGTAQGGSGNRAELVGEAKVVTAWLPKCSVSQKTAWSPKQRNG